MASSYDVVSRSDGSETQSISSETLSLRLSQAVNDTVGSEAFYSALNEDACMVAAEEWRQADRGVRHSARKEDQQARYWSYLFDNLHRVVDEIYCTCEADQSSVECEEVIMTLEVCKKDFETLMRQIEKSTYARPLPQVPASKRSPSLNWNVGNSPISSRPSSIASDDPQNLLGVHRRRIEFPKAGTGEEAAPLAEGEDSREPTPIGTLFSTHGLDVTLPVTLVTNDPRAVDRNTRCEQFSNPDPNLAASIPIVRRSHGGKVHVCVDSCAPAGYHGNATHGKLESDFQDEKTESLGGGWEVVQSKRRKKKGREDAKGLGVGDKGSDAGSRSKVAEGPQGDIETSHKSSSTLPASDAKGGEETQGLALRTPPSEVQCFLETNESDSYLNPDGSSSLMDRLACSDGAIDMFQTEDGEDVRYLDHQRATSSQTDYIIIPTLAKSPAKLYQLHQKLSSPQRRKLIDSLESRKLLEEKLAKAQQQRDKLQEEKAQRLRNMTEKISEVKQTRDLEIERRRIFMMEKFQKAKTLRDSYIQEIVRKAQTEATKKNEIAFINTLEAQNKRMEVLERHLGHEARLHGLQEHRLRKKEEQLAKEEAAQERRRTREAERKARMLELHYKRQEQEAKREQRLFERERAREEAAKEKAKERERKLVAVQTAQQSSVEELERKIQIKHTEYAKRYDMQLEQIREKAALTSKHVSEDSLRVTPFEKRQWCKLCQVKIISELYMVTHLRSKRHQEAMASLKENAPDSSVIVEMEDDADLSRTVYHEIIDKLKVNKKRVKKLRSRMANRTKQQSEITDSYVKKVLAESDISKLHSEVKGKLQKLLKDLRKQLDTCGNAPWSPSNALPMEKTLGELMRSIKGKTLVEQVIFGRLGGLSIISCALSRLTAVENGRKPPTPPKTILLLSSVFCVACEGCQENCIRSVEKNHLQPVIDMLMQVYLQHIHEISEVQIAYTKEKVRSSQDRLKLLSTLLKSLAVVFSTLAQAGIDSIPSDDRMVFDPINYLVAMGVLESMSASFSPVCGPLDDQILAELLLSSVNLLIGISATLHLKKSDVFSPKVPDEFSNFLDVLQRTELFGVPTLLYAILLHAGPPRHSTTPPILPSHTLAIAMAAVKLINNCFLIQLNVVQSCLGDESLSVQFRGITSYLIWHCKEHSNEQLLQELIVAAGYFCVLNPHNQVLLKAGRSPTLLQLLCTLPFEYFSDPRLKDLLFPTLVVACYQSSDNRHILTQEISTQLLIDYIKIQIDRTSDLESVKAEASKLTDADSFKNRFPVDQWRPALKFFSMSAEQ